MKYLEDKSLISGLTIDRDAKYFYYADTDGFLWQSDYESHDEQWANAYDHPSDYVRGTAVFPRSLSKYDRGFFWLDRREGKFPGVQHLEQYFPNPVNTEIKSAWTVRVRHPSLQKTSRVKVLSWKYSR